MLFAAFTKYAVRSLYIFEIEIYIEPNVSTVICNLNDIGIVRIIFYSNTLVGYKLP